MPAPARPSLFTITLLLLATASWGSNWVVARALHAEVPPMAMAFWRWVAASLFMLPLAWPHLGGDWPRLRASWRRMLPLGIAGCTGLSVLGYLAMQHTTATNASLINGSLPMMIVGLMALLPSGRASGRLLLGIVVSALGVMCIILRGDPMTLLTLSLNPGDLLMLAGVFVWAAYTVALRWRPAGLHESSFTIALFLVGAASCLPLYLWEMSAGTHMRVSAGTVGGLVHLALFPSILAYQCWSYAVPRVGAGVAGAFSNLTPVFGTLWAALFLDEALRVWHVAGLALVFTGIAIATRARRPVAAAATPATGR